jgi:hypothetical protein
LLPAGHLLFYKARVMRILHLGAPLLADALRAQGHDVYTVGLGSGCQIQIEHPITCKSLLEHLGELRFTPDLSLLLDDGHLPFLVGIEQLPCVSIFYSIDTFCNPWHVPYAYAFDGIWAAQKGHLELFEKEREGCGRVAWAPLFTTSCPELAPFERRDVPVSFVGTLRPLNIPERLPFLRRFCERHPLIYMQGNYVPVFSRSRIVLNQTAAGEVNFRCFEAMACGAALLTETSINGLAELFVEGEHILPSYNRLDEVQATAIARDWLGRPAELERIARNGSELVRAKHTAQVRARELLVFSEPLISDRAHEKRLSELPLRHRFLSVAYGILAVELRSRPDLAIHQEFYQKLFGIA